MKSLFLSILLIFSILCLPLSQPHTYPSCSKPAQVSATECLSPALNAGQLIESKKNYTSAELNLEKTISLIPKFGGVALFIWYAVFIDNSLIAFAGVTLLFLIVSLILKSWADDETRIFRGAMAPFWEEGVYRGGYITALAHICSFNPAATALISGLGFWISHVDLRQGHTQGNLPRFIGTVLIVVSYYVSAYMLNLPIMTALIISSVVHLAYNVNDILRRRKATAELFEIRNTAQETGIIECPAALRAEKAEWNRAVNAYKKMKLEKGQKVLLVGGSIPFLPVVLAAHEIEVTFVDMNDMIVLIAEDFLAEYDKATGLNASRNLKTHCTNFQDFVPEQDYDQVSLLDLFVNLHGNPKTIIQNALKCVRNNGVVWMGRSYSTDVYSEICDLEKLLPAFVPINTFVLKSTQHTDIKDTGYADDFPNSAYKVTKNSSAALMPCA